jgi:hypothetical protein
MSSEGNFVSEVGMTAAYILIAPEYCGDATETLRVEEI